MTSSGLCAVRSAQPHGCFGASCASQMARQHRTERIPGGRRAATPAGSRINFFPHRTRGVEPKPAANRGAGPNPGIRRPNRGSPSPVRWLGGKRKASSVAAVITLWTEYDRETLRRLWVGGADRTYRIENSPHAPSPCIQTWHHEL